MHDDSLDPRPLAPDAERATRRPRRRRRVPPRHRRGRAVPTRRSCGGSTARCPRPSTLFEERGWLHEPATYHSDPPAPSDVRTPPGPLGQPAVHEPVLARRVRATARGARGRAVPRLPGEPRRPGHAARAPLGGSAVADLPARLRHGPTRTRPPRLPSPAPPPRPRPEPRLPHAALPRPAEPRARHVAADAQRRRPRHRPRAHPGGVGRPPAPRPPPGPRPSSPSGSWASPSAAWWRPPSRRSTSPTPCSCSSRPSTCPAWRPTPRATSRGIDGRVRPARARSTPLFAPVSPLLLSAEGALSSDASSSPERSDRFARPTGQAVALWRHWDQPDAALVPRRTRVGLLGPRRPSGDRRAAPIGRPCLPMTCDHMRHAAATEGRR